MAKDELTPINRSKCSEIQNRLKVLVASAQDFVAFVSHIDMSYDSRILEIQNLERQRDKLKEEVQAAQQKADGVIQEARTTADKNQLEILKLVQEAKTMRLAVEEDKKKAQVMKQEADAVMAAAVEKQKMADMAFQIVEDRKKKLAAAMS